MDLKVIGKCFVEQGSGQQTTSEVHFILQDDTLPHHQGW